LAGSARAQTAAVAIDALIDGRSRLVIQDGAIHWEHVEFERPGMWGGEFPTYVSVSVGGVVELAHFAWQPVWIDDGDISEPLDIGHGPFGSDCDPATLTLVLGRESVEVIQQPLRLNGLTTIVEFDDNEHWGADWYTVRIEWNLPQCPADINCDNAVTSQDFFQFLGFFFGGSAAADFDQDGEVNSQDFFAFLNAFFAGC
jgi:hypothetical protein